ncbi:TPR-like protein [Fomitiporia mediterranea MF3/22]|uniref:TPR-like protein n=1 Tax=Fomitiporia mediterranea (strain MF3/22) TaxID=694068 RepID=R7SFV9_FOMME|nr:TPR-like protein [Fomitiporia mediterranea MF3/22]EJC97606.1 TPR-like protein [Fomitiporia mediterranea MF3/22]
MEYYVDLESVCRGLYNLALKNWDRFEQSGERGELDKSIFHGRVLLGLYPERHQDRNKASTILGNFLSRRFKQYGRMEDLEEAVECYRVALELCPDGHPNRPISLGNLSSSLQTRFSRHGKTADLDEAIEHSRTALNLFPNSHPYHSMSLNLLADSLHTRFEQCGRTVDLDEAVKYHRAALDLCPLSHPNRPVSLNCLAGCLEARFRQLGQTADLDEAVKYHRAALELCPHGHPNRLMSLNNLAGSLQTRFHQYGQAADLDEAVMYHRAALETRAKDHPNLSMSMNNLALSLQVRFEQHGRTTDLDEAIELYRSALGALPSDDPRRSLSQSNLADSLQARYNQYGQTADLDEAINLYHSALELYPGGHPHRSSSLNNLAHSLQARFEQHRQMADLDEAIELCRFALEICPDGHPNRSASLNNLANSLQTLFQQHGQTTDLDEAVQYHRASLEICGNSQPSRSKYLAGLASSLHSRFEQHGRTADLDEAIKHSRAAVELCPEGNSQHSGSLRNLAIPLLSRFKKFGDKDDLEECMQLFERATVHKFSSAVMRLETASQWASFARSHAHHTTSRAYKAAMLLLQKVLVVNPTLPAQHDFLKGVNHYRTLTLDAVAYAIESNRFEEAVEILEQGRGLLWSQMRGFRAPLDRLAETNKELADRFRSVNSQLESLAISSAESPSDTSTARNALSILDAHEERKLFEERLKLKKQLSSEQEEVINKIRRLPGFENFLAATPFKVLQHATSDGPVIVINHCNYRSDALIVSSRENFPIVCIPLDGEFFNDSIELYIELLETRFHSGADSPEYDQILCQVMKTLWDRVVSKVVDKLIELGIAEGSRIWWCPTFVLSIEDTDGATRYLLDKFVSSYAPTLGALVDAQSCKGTEEPTVLVIGDTSLPSAKSEIRNIKNCGIKIRLLNNKTSHKTVIKALRATAWVHFVCHGGLDPQPFNSSFKVSDRGLTLLDIVQANLPNAEFAFLSACHTAEQPHDGIHDEVLHLAAAMQFSGFRSVIGSMWELLDVDGPFFARKVYEFMCDCDEGEARYKRAAAGLRKAAVELKGRPDIRTERWVNLIHIGA